MRKYKLLQLGIKFLIEDIEYQSSENKITRVDTLVNTNEIKKC